MSYDILVPAKRSLLLPATNTVAVVVFVHPESLVRFILYYTRHDCPNNAEFVVKLTPALTIPVVIFQNSRIRAVLPKWLYFEPE